MKFKTLIGIVVGILFAVGIVSLTPANTHTSGALAQKAPDCKYLPCD